jgi:hypothetical protein
MTNNKDEQGTKSCGVVVLSGYDAIFITNITHTATTHNFV